MGDRLDVRVLGRLNRFGRQLVAQFAFGPALIELGISKMAEMAGRLSYLEVLHFGLVLVAGGAVDLHPLDLVLLCQVGFMDKGYLLCEFNLLGTEWVIRFPMARGGHTAGIGDLRHGFHGFASQFDIGKMTGRDLGNMVGTELWSSHRNPGPWSLRLVVAFNTAYLVVFVLLPGFVTLINDIRISKNVAVAAEALRLGNVQL